MAAPASCPSSFDVLAAFEAAFDFYFDPEDTHASFRPDDPHVVLALEFFGMLREPLAPLIEGVRGRRAPTLEARAPGAASAEPLSDTRGKATAFLPGTWGLIACTG